MNLSEFKKEIPTIFEKVKSDVKGVLGRHRSGLALGLADMGMNRGGFIGGMYFNPGTDIVMNKSPLRIVLESHPYEISWAYTYHILLSLYLKSLGVIDEHQCKVLSLKVSKEIFKETDHPAIILAEESIGAFIPNLKISCPPSDRRPDGMPIEYLTSLDKEKQSYIS